MQVLLFMKLYMKNTYFLFVLLTCLTMLTQNVVAQDKAPVEAAVSKLVEAIIEADRVKLDKIAHAGLVYGHSSGAVQDKNAFIEEIASKKPLDYLTVDLQDQTIQVNGNVAVVRHIYIATAVNQANEKVNIRIGNMLVFVKDKKDWKLTARQAYKL
jgi:ketosteroid isomerase-like protein